MVEESGPPGGDDSVVPIQGDGAGDRGIRALETGLRNLVAGRARGQRREMTTRELPATKMVVGSAPYSGPCSRTRAITFFTWIRRIGELVVRGTAVVRADAYPALAGKPIEEVARSETLAAEAGVKVDECRAARSIGAIAIEVEQVCPARRAVADVRDSLDAAAAEGDRREQDASEGGATAEPSDEIGVHAVAPVGSEALVQGALERPGPVLRRSLTEDDQPGRCNHGETQSDPEPGRVDAVLVDREGRRGDEQQEGD